MSLCGHLTALGAHLSAHTPDVGHLICPPPGWGRAVACTCCTATSAPGHCTFPPSIRSKGAGGHIWISVCAFSHFKGRPGSWMLDPLLILQQTLKNTKLPSTTTAHWYIPTSSALTSFSCPQKHAFSVLFSNNQSNRCDISLYTCVLCSNSLSQQKLESLKD